MVKQLRRALKELNEENAECERRCVFCVCICMCVYLGMMLSGGCEERVFVSSTNKRHKLMCPYILYHSHRILGQEKELKAAAEALAHTNAKG